MAARSVRPSRRARPSSSRPAPRKLEALRAAGVDPFPHAFPGVVPIAAARDAHADLEAGAETETRDRVAGRLAARRGQGKTTFLDLVDRSGRIQLRPRSTSSARRRFERLRALDLGDLIGVDGTVFRSRHAAS